MSDEEDSRIRYRCVGFEMSPAWRNAALYSSVGNSALALESSRLAEILRALQGPARTLDEHAMTLAEHAFFRGQTNGIASTLRTLAQIGLLLSVNDLKTHAVARTPDGVRIAALGIVTKNRPEMLDRAVTSFAENIKAHGRDDTKIVVIDDTEAEVLQDQTRAHLRSLTATYGIALEYAGLKEKQTFVAALSRHAGVPREVVEFALFNREKWPFAAGANRNALQLHMAGEPYVSVDDDVVCRLAAPPNETHGLRLTSVGAGDCFYFASREAALASARFVDVDFLHAHERLLGRDVGTCIAEWESTSIDFDTVGGSFATRLGDAGGTITHTGFNLLGDNGYALEQSYFLLMWNRRLMESATFYKDALASRQVHEGFWQHTISDRAEVQGLVGLAPILLPPFPPVGGSEQAVFGELLRACQPSGFVGLVPLAALHDPVPARAFLMDPYLRTLTKPRARDLMQSAVSTMVEEAPLANIVDPARRMLVLGEGFLELGKLPSPEFDRQMRLAWYRMQCSALNRVEQRLMSAENEDEPWCSDLKLHVVRLKQALHEGPEHSLGFGDGPANVEGFSSLQRMLQQFGALMMHWPALTEGAKELRRTRSPLAW